MSVEALAIALRHSRAHTATTKLVLLGIANHDGDGGSWPSVATLATYALCSTRQVQRAVDELEQLGEVERIVQKGGTRWTSEHRRPNLYRFLLRCPPDCDRTANHRTRRSTGPMVDLELPDDGVTPMSPHDPDLSTGVTPMSPQGVTPMSPEPSIETNPSEGPVDQPQTAHEGWTSACIDGRMDTHQPSRKLDGRCGYCGASRVRWTETP